MNSFKPTLEPYTESSIKSPYENICFLLDTSGSTNNCGSRGSRRGIIESKDKEEDVITKPIIYAIEEGISNCMNLLANKYNLSEISLKIASFDSDCRICIDKTLSNSNELFQIANNLDEIVSKKFSSTNMSDAIKFTVNDFTKNTLLILASDGRPDNPSAVLVELDKINENFTKQSKIFDMFVIGAGSIQESKYGNMNISCYRNTRTITEDNQEVIKKMQRQTTAECDHYFLNYLIEKSRVGGYSGAYKDYSDLKIGFNSYIEKINDFRPFEDKSFHVKLDNGMIKYSDQTQIDIVNLLKTNGKFLLLENGYILAITNDTQSYQIHVEEITNYNSTEVYDTSSDQLYNINRCHIENVDDKNYFDFYLNVEKQVPINMINVVFVNVSIKDGVIIKRYFRPDLTRFNEFRVRRIILA